jgi:pSer/pThr/pTyr-binding forkhead associated (FHA) protein
VVQGESVGKQFKLEPGENLIGRWDPERGAFPEIDLENEDVAAKVSRKHAVIIVRDADFFLEDVGSLNGTFLNDGFRIDQGVSYKMIPGDEIHLGNIVLRLCTEDRSSSGMDRTIFEGEDI